MKFSSKVASALSFAHLAGIGQRSKAESDDSDKKDDDKVNKSKAEDDDQDKNDQDRENVDSKKSEDDKDDKSAEGDDPDKKDDNGDEKGKAKGKAKADDDEADAEDDDDEEMRGKSAAANARRRERARCAAIFGSKSAARNPVLAANLAFSTSMTRKEALAVLDSTPAAASGASDRSTRNPSLATGGNLQNSSKQAVASSWDAAFKKVAPRR